MKNNGAASRIAGSNERKYMVSLHSEIASITGLFQSTWLHLEFRDGTAVPTYARQKRCGGGDRNGIRKSKNATPLLKTVGRKGTARSGLDGSEMGTENAGESKLRYDLALSLEVAGEEAPRGSDHNLATGTRGEGSAWP
jgi:hypothetical protein